MAKKSLLINRWFNAYRVGSPDGQGQLSTSRQFYFVESSAPINVDQPVSNEGNSGKIQLVPALTSEVIDEIVNSLKVSVMGGKKKADLVVLVHGFNNPRATLLNDLFAQAYEASKDPAIAQSASVCIGYRWPSENIGRPLSTLLSAAPFTLLAFLLIGPALLAWSVFNGVSLLTWLGVLLVGVALAAFTLRVIVYYRDQYRATQYGAPDLVELVRDIASRLTASGIKHNEVNLSFVAHSMGAYVVTNAIRTLSDLFLPAALDARGVSETDDSGNLAVLGSAFTLSRLVLVAPDIPAEVLISSRANVLASSLRRFAETYLFSNEGDEVLRMISTAANYFAFPTANRKHGYRLGNAGVIVAGQETAGSSVGDQVRVGFSSLRRLGEQMNDVDSGFADRLRYFDCTYFRDGQGRTLTGGAALSSEPIGIISHAIILVRYLRGQFDVHGGYFQAETLRKMIFRLASLGWDAADEACLKLEQQGLRDQCRSKQIKLL